MSSYLLYFIIIICHNDSGICIFLSLIVSSDIFCEFLDVAFHCILYVRELYPVGIFKRKKKYNVPVQV